MAKTRNTTLVAQVGARIRQVRLARGLTQAQVAERANCDPQTVQRAETGRYGLSLTRLEAVAAGLGVGVADLFAEVSTAVPESPWSPEEVQVAATWRKVPEERRAMALRVLVDIAEG